MDTFLKAAAERKYQDQGNNKSKDKAAKPSKAAMKPTDADIKNKGRVEAIEAVKLMRIQDQQKKQEDTTTDESKNKLANEGKDSTNRKTADRGESREQFYLDEGKICQFYLDGYCKYGEECQDIHDNEDEQHDHKSRRRSTKEKPKQVRSGSLEKDDESQYSKPKAHVCQFFLQNRCRFGRYCKNEHPDL